jgi:hypothetical protein
MKVKLILAAFVLSTCAWAAPKRPLVIHPVSNISKTYTQTIGGNSSTTNCSDAGYSLQCNTQNGVPVTLETDVVRQVVLGDDGMQYTMFCSAKWRWDKCSPLTLEPSYDAEIDGKTMWVHARQGGNLGKPVKIKFQLVDMRPAEKVNQP